MRLEKNFSLAGELLDVTEGIRAYYLGEGYQEVLCEKNRLVVEKPGSWKGNFGYKIEELKTRAEFEFIPREHSTGTHTVRVHGIYDVSTRFRLISRLDTLYFDLEIDDLQQYFQTGFRRSVSRRLNDVRTPVAMTAMSNTLLTALLVACAGLLVKMDLVTICFVSLGVSLINFVSIMGFADIVVDGMERLISSNSRHN